MPLNDSTFAQAWEELSAAKSTRKAAVQRIVADRANEPAWARFFASNAERLEQRGALGLLEAATSRPANDDVRRAAEAWLERAGDSVPAWLRLIDGPPLSPRPDPSWSCQAIPDGTSGLCRAPNGHLWVWSQGGRSEVHEWDPVTKKRLRKVRTPFEPNSVDVNDEGWLAVSARGGESTVLVWNEARKRVHKVDTGKDMARVRWVLGPAPTLLVVDGGVCLVRLEAKARPAWRHARRDLNAGPPIEHAALLPGGSEVLALEIDDGGAARACTIRLSDGELLRTVDLAPVFPTADPLGAMALSPNGTELAFGPTLINDGIRIFDLSTGNMVRQVLPERGKVTVLRFATDRELWCGTQEGLVLHIDLDSGIARGLRASQGAVTGLELAGDSLFVSTSEGQLRAFSQEDCNADPDALKPTPLAHGVITTSRAALFAVGSALWQVREGDEMASLSVQHLPPGSPIAVDSLERCLVVASVKTKTTPGPSNLEAHLGLIERDATLDPENPIRVRELTLDGDVDNMLITDKWLIMGNGAGGAGLCAVSRESLVPERRRLWDGKFTTVYSLCLCEHTHEIACSLLQGPLFLLSEAGHPVTVLHRPEAGDHAVVLKLLAMGPQLHSVASDGALRCFNLDSRQLSAQLRLSPNPAFREYDAVLSGSLATDRVLATSGTGPALLIRASDVSIVASLGEKHPIVFGGMSSDGRRAFIVGDDMELTVWETERGLRLASFALNARTRGVWWLGSREILVWEAGLEMLRYRLERA